MAKGSKDYGLLIAAIVAIVAIVGLVILFAGGSGGTGAIPGCDYYCPYGQEGRGQGAFICSDVPCQGPGPFWTVQEADVRRLSIAQEGFGN